MKRFLIVFVLLGLILFFPASAFAYYTNMPASVVVGQPDFVSSSPGSGTSGVNTPWDVVSDGQRLFVSDLNSNRVLIYNSIPTRNGTVPDVIIGQQDFSGTSANQGGSCGANTLSGPRQLSV